MMRGLPVVLSFLAVVMAVPAHAEPSGLTDLVDAAAARLEIADPVAANKWLTGGPLTDPPRVQQVLDAVTSDAQSQGVSTEFVRRAFTDQINATEGIEYSRFADWKFGTSPTPTTAPELASSRSLIDGLNHTMVRQFSLQWPTLQSPSCVAELALVKAKVADQRQFDTLFRQALDVATQSYCSA